MYCIKATYIPRDGMFFDEAYYVANHIPMAQRLLTGHVNFVRMGAEFNVALLRDSNAVRSPCVYHLYVPAIEDVEAFRRFVSGPLVLPLRNDMREYTNCECEWTVSKYVPE